MRVAVIGTDIMNAPMARDVCAAGHEVSAWNRSREKAEPLAEHGVSVAGSVAEAVAGAEVVVTMLADAPAVGAVAEEALGALAAVGEQMRRAAAGADDVLGCLEEGRVDTLLLAADFRASGIAERATEKALESSAEVAVVRHHDLSPHDGIAALLRY